MLFLPYLLLFYGPSSMTAKARGNGGKPLPPNKKEPLSLPPTVLGPILATFSCDLMEVLAVNLSQPTFEFLV